jgi:hypothetical protein
MSTATPTRKKKAPVRAKKTSVRPAPWDSPRRSGREPSFIEEARRKQILDVSLATTALRSRTLPKPSASARA